MPKQKGFKGILAQMKITKFRKVTKVVSSKGVEGKVKIFGGSLHSMKR